MHLYEEHGPRFAERLRGMFAIAVWDGARQRLVLARDRFGIKPLYYRDGGRVCVRLRAQGAPPAAGLRRATSTSTRSRSFLAFNAIHGPRTIFRAVRKLPPGHVLVLEDDVVRLERYARRAAGARATATSRGTRSPPSCASACATRSARTWWPTCRSACCCPGGIDSSALAALAATETRPRARRSRSGSPSGRSPSSSRRARSPSATGPTTTSSCCEPDAAELLPRDRAPRSTSRSPTRRRCRPTWSPELAAEHVKVALSGEGGDELFGGYETYVADLLAQRAGPAAARALAARRAAAERLGPRAARLQAQALHARRAPAAARAPPRLEGDLLGRRAGRAAAPRAPGHGGPARRLSRALGARPRARTCSRACRTSIARSTSSTTCS